MPKQGALLFKTIPLLDSQIGKALVSELCKAERLSEATFWDLVAAELAYVGKQQKPGIASRFDGALDQDEQANVD